MIKTKRGYTIAIDLGQSSVIVAAGYKDDRGALQIAAVSATMSMELSLVALRILLRLILRCRRGSPRSKTLCT